MEPHQEQIGKDVPNRAPRRSASGLIVMVLLLALLGLTIFALSSVWAPFRSSLLEHAERLSKAVVGQFE